MTAQDVSLPTIEQVRSLRSSVTDALRTAIIVGDLQEGELYSAPTLATQLGVSATPVREAMMDLAGEGMVVTVKNKGFRVTTMTAAALEQLTQVRQLLEGPAMRALAGHLPEEEVDDLTALADEIETAAKSSDLRTYLTSDREFHRRLVAFTGNELVVDLTSRLRGQTRLKALRGLAESGQLVHSAREHHQLLELLQSGDAEEAHQLILRHIGHSSRLWSTGREEPEHDAAGAHRLLDLLPELVRSAP